VKDKTYAAYTLVAIPPEAWCHFYLVDELAFAPPNTLLKN